MIRGAISHQFTAQDFLIQCNTDNGTGTHKPAVADVQLVTTAGVNYLGVLRCLRPTQFPIAEQKLQDTLGRGGI